MDPSKAAKPAEPVLAPVDGAVELKEEEKEKEEKEKETKEKEEKPLDEPRLEPVEGAKAVEGVKGAEGAELPAPQAANA